MQVRIKLVCLIIIITIIICAKKDAPQANDFSKEKKQEAITLKDPDGAHFEEYPLLRFELFL